MKKILISLVSSALLFVSSSLPASVTVSAGLKGTYNDVPAELQAYSPLLGAVIAENGELAALYKQENALGNLARALFNELNGTMRCTVKLDDPASALTPQHIHDLILQLRAGKPCTDLFPQDEPQNPNKMNFLFRDRWLTTYKNWLGNLQKKDTEKKFRLNGRKVLIKLDAAAAHNSSKTQELLLAYGYLKCTTPEQLQEFAQLFYPDLVRTLFTDPEFYEFAKFFKNTTLTQESAQNNVEQMVFWLLKRKAGTLEFLKPSLQYVVENEKRIPLCVEGAIQTIVNCTLYDPQTKLLTTSMLPQSVTASLNPRFKDFIDRHKNPQIKDYYASTLTDWINLLTGIPGVVYDTGDKEIAPTDDSILATLNFLFGTNAKNFKNLSDLISSDTRVIKVMPLDSDDDGDDDDNILGEILREEFPEEFAPTEPVTADAPTASSNNSESGDNSNDDSDDEDNDDNEKQYIKFSFTSPHFTPVLKLMITAGHSEANFIQKNDSFIPTIQELDNLMLMGNLLGHNLLTLFNVDWYKTVLTFYKNKVFTTGPEFLKFLKKYPVTPQEIAAPSRYDADVYLLEDFIFLGKRDFVEAFIQFGVDITQFPGENNPFKNNPLIRALYNPRAHKAGISQLLLDNGATLDPETINTPNEYGSRILNFAADASATRFLLEHGANPNLPDAMGETPLFRATFINDLESMKVLLEHKANPNIMNNSGQTPLYLASFMTRNKEAADLLLRNGADPKKNPQLLRLVMYVKSPEIARLLLEYGADPRIKDEYHSSALDAVRNMAPELTELVRQKAAELDRLKEETAQQVMQEIQEISGELHQQTVLEQSATQEQ